MVKTTVVERNKPSPTTRYGLYKTSDGAYYYHFPVISKEVEINCIWLHGGHSGFIKSVRDEFIRIPDIHVEGTVTMEFTF